MRNSLKYVVFLSKTFVMELRDIRQVIHIDIIEQILTTNGHKYTLIFYIRQDDRIGRDNY